MKKPQLKRNFAGKYLAETFLDKTKAPKKGNPATIPRPQKSVGQSDVTTFHAQDPGAGLHPGSTPEDRHQKSPKHAGGRMDSIRTEGSRHRLSSRHHQVEMPKNGQNSNFRPARPCPCVADTLHPAPTPSITPSTPTCQLGFSRAGVPSLKPKFSTAARWAAHASRQ